MKTKLMAMLLMAGSTMFAGVRFGVGINIGVPAPIVAPYPGPGYVMVNGVWTLPPYDGAYWVAPSYFGGRYVAGYWGGAPHFDRGFDHDDHRFDRGHADRNRGRNDFRGRR